MRLQEGHRNAFCKFSVAQKGSCRHLLFTHMFMELGHVTPVTGYLTADLSSFVSSGDVKIDKVSHLFLIVVT